MSQQRITGQDSSDSKAATRKKSRAEGNESSLDHGGSLSSIYWTCIKESEVHCIARASSSSSAYQPQIEPGKAIETDNVAIGDE